MPYKLATSLDDVDEYLANDSPRGFMGMDTEATGLDTRRAGLVGMSMSFSAGSALYVPIGHKIGSNLPFVPVWERVAKRLETVRPVFYNAKYDLNILNVAVVKAKMPFVLPKYEDALEAVYLADPDVKRNGLKDTVKKLFGFDMERFEELFSPEELRSGVLDISTKSPARCLDYACADSDWGLQVWDHYAPVREEFAMAMTIDTPLINVVRKMEHNGGMELNGEYIEEQIKHLDARAEALREQIFRLAGYTFEINSPKQLGIALFEKMAIPSPGKTKGKAPIHVTKEEVLEKLRGAYPVIELVISYRKVVKAKSSYFLKLQHLMHRGIKPRFHFNMFAAPTFRFAAPGGSPEKDGGTGVNIQAVSNGESRDVLGVDLTKTPEGEDYTAKVATDDILIDLREAVGDTELPPWTGDLLSLPYVVPTEAEGLVCFREACSGCPARCAGAGIDVTRRTQKGLMMIPSVRQSFRAPKGWKLVTFDYDRQELVIGANMSQEPRWLRALMNRDDLHAMTAAAAFGMSIDDFNRLPKAEKKRKRDIGKVLNFAIFYGATAYTLAIKADISKAAAEQIYDGFVKGHPVLMGWIQKVHIFSKKNGYTTTFFGRKRWLKDMYADPAPKMQAFANRSAVNTAIQGTAAEVTRIAMVKVDRALTNAGYTWNEVKFAMQIHDELAFLIRDELVRDVVPIIKNAMEFKVKSWQVQLSVGPKMGNIWGKPFMLPTGGMDEKGRPVLSEEVDLAKLAANDYEEFLRAA